MKKFHAAAALLAVGLLGTSLAACNNTSDSPRQSARAETPGQYIDDTAISTKVRAQLIDDKDLNLFQIDVTTNKGVVQLTGVVNSPAAKARATSVVAATEGVRGVRNDLIVR